MAVALLAAGCGTSSGLQVESNGTTTPIVKPREPSLGSTTSTRSPFPARATAGRRDGAIIATADGGATWTQQYTGQADIRSLYFTDQRHGWAVASASLLRTVNGGNTWSPAGEPAGLVLTGVAFAGPDDGWGVALPAGEVGAPVPGTLVATTDGGSRWTVVN